MTLISSSSVGTAPAEDGDRLKEAPMSGLSEYTVEVNGHETTLQLSDEDAKLRGLTKAAAPAKAKSAPANKAAAPQNKAAAEQ